MKVSIVKTTALYPETPFHPSEHYPEYPYSKEAISNQENSVYDAVREALYLMGLDRENYGTPHWNPFREFIKEGSRIVIKPNFVNHYNLSVDDQAHFEALVTHASVIRPLIDYIILATRGKFTLTIADLPIQTADFSVLVRKTQLDKLIEFVSKKTSGQSIIELVDLRDYQLMIDRVGAILGRKELPGDPSGYAVVDLGNHSNLVPIQKDAHLFRAPDYKNAITVKMHSNDVHLYSLSRTILKSDFFINVPKLKVHRKTGATLSLKNIVGTIGDKSCLPHYRQGGPDTGGDEQAVSSFINSLRGRHSFSLRRLGRIPWKFIIRPMGRVLMQLNQMAHKDQRLINVTGGDWYGNDTVWRMVHDVNCILFHSDAQGVLHDKFQKHYLTVVDGITGGEGEGPLSPSPVASGVIVAGVDPLAVDVCCTRLMGLDWRKIPLFAKYNSLQRFTFSKFNSNPEQIAIILSRNNQIMKQQLDDIHPVHRFEPSPGWKKHIEL